MFVRLGTKKTYSQRQLSRRHTPSFTQQRHMSFWKYFSFPTTTSNKPESPDTLNQALDDNKPSFLKPDKQNHHEVQRKTIAIVTDPAKYHDLLETADRNLTNWSKNKKASPQYVEVMRGDWGDITQLMTKKHGEIYAVLNMANAYFFGGDFLGGGSAQEENMFLRTTCCSHLKEESLALYLDKETNTFRYKDEKTQLINAKVKMTPLELATLSEIRGKTIAEAYKVHMDTAEPEVCFRGPELFYIAENLGIENTAKTNRIALSEYDGSFAPLKDDDIFPFDELRAAALDLTDKTINVNWNDEKFLAWFRMETKQRIEAQLDTALLNGRKHVVLCAFGCGAFKNKPEEVAKIYREAIEERANCFEHIVFAIYHPGYGMDNFHPFHKELDKIPLSQAAMTAKYSSPRFNGTRE